MSEAMKKPTTGGYVEVRFRIPATKVVEAKRLWLPMAPLPRSRSPCLGRRSILTLTGVWLSVGARKREALTQKELAHLVGVSQTHISEMEHGKRPIGKDMARRLAKVLKVNYRVFLYKIIGRPKAAEP